LASDSPGPSISPNKGVALVEGLPTLRIGTSPNGNRLNHTLKGLPDDRCQCPHWGYVKTGKVAFTYTDGHTETYEAGDAYYVPPGHTPHLYAGSGVVEFHPTAERAKTVKVVEKDMAAMSP
jgi:hypothetical protein